MVMKPGKLLRCKEKYKYYAPGGVLVPFPVIGQRRDFQILTQFYKTGRCTITQFALNTKSKRSQ